MSGDGKELTPRELEVLNLITQGKLNKHIADELGIALSTVKNYVTSILRKLGAYNRAHAVILAQERGLLPQGNGKPTPNGCDFNCGKIGEPMIALMNTDSGNKWTCHLSCLKDEIERHEALRG